MSFWIFIATHSGFPSEIIILLLSLLIYFHKDLFACPPKYKSTNFWRAIKQITIITIAFGLFRLTGEFLKNGLAFPRSCWSPAYPSLIPCPDSFSLPSGHALGAFMLAVFTSLVFQIRLIWLISLSLAISVSLSRYFTGVHTLLDITVGSILGTLFGFLLWKFYWKKENIHEIAKFTKRKGGASRGHRRLPPWAGSFRGAVKRQDPGAVKK